MTGDVNNILLIKSHSMQILHKILDSITQGSGYNKSWLVIQFESDKIIETSETPDNTFNTSTKDSSFPLFEAYCQINGCRLSSNVHL